MINNAIFKTYDVRGVYPEEINEEAAYLIARAFVQWLKHKTRSKNHSVAVGYDMRLSSKSLFDAVLDGLIAEGANILPVGFAPTPLIGFSVAHKECDAGIVVSASHNPAQYNALKLLKRERSGIMQIGKTQGLNEIENIVLTLNNIYRLTSSAAKWETDIEKYQKNYIRYIISRFKLQKPMKIVCDYGNGMGGVLMPKIFSEFENMRVINLFSEPNGAFPNHEPNPHNEENFSALKNEVKNNSADAGLFFDGDCDRVFFVDENGDIVPADMIIILLADYELNNNPGKKTIYYDLRSSRALKEILEPRGATCVKMPTGNPLIKEDLIFKGGLMGGEMSGHIMFTEHFCLDDGFFTALKVLKIMDKKNKPLSELIKPYKKYFKIHEINIPLRENPKTVLQKLDKKFKSLYMEAKFDYLDGITVEFNDWWFNVRASNTESLLRLNLEANSKELMEQSASEIASIIKTT